MMSTMPSSVKVLELKLLNKSIKIKLIVMREAAIKNNANCIFLSEGMLNNAKNHIKENNLKIEVILYKKLLSVKISK
jgi:hypothetical protein